MTCCRRIVSDRKCEYRSDGSQNASIALTEVIMRVSLWRKW